MNETERYQLWWLSKQGKPLWGDHIERNESLANPEIKSWLDAGLITLADSGKGYVITAKGLGSLRD